MFTVTKGKVRKNGLRMGRMQAIKKNNKDWDAVIRPQTGWLNIDLKGIVRYRDLIWLLVKRNFVLTY